mgnify:CR=1 FL=1
MGKYDPNTESFETVEDVEMLQEVQSDLDDDSLDFLEFDEDEMKSVKLEIASNHPIYNKYTEKIIDVNGEDETKIIISNFTNSLGVSFAQDKCYVYDDEITTSSLSSNSKKKTIQDLERQIESTRKTLNDTKAASISEEANDAARKE